MSLDHLLSRRNFIRALGLAAVGAATLPGQDLRGDLDAEDRRLSAEDGKATYLFEALHLTAVQPGRAVFELRLHWEEEGTVEVVTPLPASHPGYPAMVQSSRSHGTRIADIQEAVRDALLLSGGLIDETLYVVNKPVMRPRGISFYDDSAWLNSLLKLKPGGRELVHSSRLRWLMKADDSVFAVRVLA